MADIRTAISNPVVANDPVSSSITFTVLSITAHGGVGKLGYGRISYAILSSVSTQQGTTIRVHPGMQGGMRG